MGTVDGRNFMPDDRAWVLCPRNTRLSQRKVLDALGIEMNFAMLAARETLEQFGEGTLGAVAAIDEW